MKKVLNSLSRVICYAFTLISLNAIAGTVNFGQHNINTINITNNSMNLKLDLAVDVDEISIDLSNIYTADVVSIFDSNGNQFQESGLVYSLKLPFNLNGVYELKWVFTDPLTGESLDIIGFIGINTQSIRLQTLLDSQENGFSILQIPIVSGDYNFAFPVELSPVPEPSEFLMIFLGLLIILYSSKNLTLLRIFRVKR